MIPLSVMLGTTPLGEFSTHKCVTDLGRFWEGLKMHHREIMKMKVLMILDNTGGVELYESVLAHAAVFGEVVANFNAAKA